MRTINENHCSHCGSTLGEDIFQQEDNYSGCCNEPIVCPLPGETCVDMRCHHED